MAIEKLALAASDFHVRGGVQYIGITEFSDIAQVETIQDRLFLRVQQEITLATCNKQQQVLI